MELTRIRFKWAPQEAMQFGRALDRLLYKIRHANPKYGPVYMATIDISDGFYRIGLTPDTAPKLAVVIPSHKGEPPLVAIPLSLPMGWVESPPVFCATTETVADLSNQRMGRKYEPPHRLENDSDTRPVEPEPDKIQRTRLPGTWSHAPLPTPKLSPPSKVFEKPLSYVDVYVDDFCNLVQGDRRRRKIVKRILMNTIDEVLRAPDPSRTEQKEPISVKKLRQGDAYWATKKVLLGWVIDTIDQTLCLAPHRLARLQPIFDELRHVSRVSVKQWQTFIGELRSMVLGIPGGRGLFSTLQHGFRQSDKFRIRIDSNMQAQLVDFEILAQDLAYRPTRIAEIVPDLPSATGAVDASGIGMGGVWFANGQAPVLWRAKFPGDIQKRLVSWTNPSGDLTNSDFELAGVIMHQDVLAQKSDVRELTVSILNDNMAAISRSKKGSTTTQAAAAYLLRIASLQHQRHHRYLARHDYISGPANAMADDCSPLWHLTDTQLLAHFNSTYPQEKVWIMSRPRRKMLSTVTSGLRKTRLEPQFHLNVPPTRTRLGNCGAIFVPNSTSTTFWKAHPTQSRISWYSDNMSEMAVSPKAVNRFDIERWKRPTCRGPDDGQHGGRGQTSNCPKTTRLPFGPTHCGVRQK
jgi:hypothetical protein